MPKTIADMRNAKKLTQKELAEIVGATQGAVCQWENGDTYPRPPTIVKLSEALDESEGDIIAAVTAAMDGEKT